MKKTNGIELSKSEFSEEHTKLLKTLKRPTKRGLKREIKEQSGEMRKVLSKKR